MILASRTTSQTRSLPRAMRCLPISKRSSPLLASPRPIAIGWRPPNQSKRVHQRSSVLAPQHDRVWVTFETGKGKVAITEAKFLYTLSPRWMDSTRGHREEWFSAAATIQDGRVTAIMPPGATHGAFCLRDANDFLITSESMPSFQEISHGTTDTKILENGFAYKPGLFALIKLGEQARNSAKKANLDTTVLEAAIASARQAHESEDDSDVLHCNAIRMLRVAIRSQEGRT